MTRDSEENLLKRWGVVITVFMMLITAIMATTGWAIQSYLGQIVSTINEVKSDLKGYMKDSSMEINGLKIRVKVLESKVSGKRLNVTDSIEY